MLADLPQRIGDLRRQAEMLAQMWRAQEQARAAAESAEGDDKPAAERALAEARRQAEQAQRQIGEQASGMMSAASASLQQSAQQMGAMGRPMTAGGQQLSSAVESLAGTLAGPADAPAQQADQQQAKVLETVAELQASLRVAQRKAIDRDPVVAARFYAERAAAALQQQPPDLPAARQYQRQTSEALGQAWDAAMARSVRDKLEQLPAFRSLLLDDVILDASADAGASAVALDRTLLAEWGRLRQKQPGADSAATAANAAFVPAGYEEQVRMYFQALDQAKSSSSAPGGGK
jgi:hypothetical protein